MKIDVVPLPRMLKDGHLRDRVVVVFDVLRATTTIAAALHAGAKEIRVFDSIDAARSAAAEFTGAKLLCGESKCLPPEGFDLGNSPGAYVPALARDKTLFLSTTNGTRALVAARCAAVLLTGALVNASAIAIALESRQRDVTLLCAGTDGEPALEDIIGAGAVIAAMNQPIHSPSALEALKSYTNVKNDLVEALESTTGGRNVFAAGLPRDITFAARINSIDIVPHCDGDTLTIHRLSQ